MSFWHPLVVATLVGTTVVPLGIVAGLVGTAVVGEAAPVVLPAGVLPAVVVVLVPAVVGSTQAMMPTVS